MRAAGIGIAPPAVQLAESQVQPFLGAHVLQRDQLTGRSQQQAAVVQGFDEKSRRVQYVGGDYEIVAVAFKALLDRIRFDVEYAIIDRRFGAAEIRFRLGEKSRGNVGIDIFVPALRKLRQHYGGCRAGAGADLYDPQLAVGGQVFDQGHGGLGEYAVRGAGARGLLEQVGRSRIAAAEQQCERVHVAAQHFGQSSGAAPKQADLDRSV